jgi:hypothetical protein
MSSAEYPENTEQVPEAQPATPTVDTIGILSAVRTLLSSEAVSDPADRTILADAIAFLEAPQSQEVASNVSIHAANVAQVMAGFEMQGQDAPPEIDAVYMRLTLQECQQHIHAARTEARKPIADKAAALHAITLALDVAKILARGYKNDSMLKEAEVLQQEINRL